MSSQKSAERDHWSSRAYNAAAGFVPKLTTTVVKYLDPQPTDRILDIGCGDGTLTAQIAASLSSGEILGLDASPGMISGAKERFPSASHNNCSFHVQDCTAFDKEAEAKYLHGKWNKVFSNAALHWILHKAETRMDVIGAIHSALEPGGSFVFEMGGFGNVSEVSAALTAALIAAGVSPAEARKRRPWFFPDDKWMRSALEDVGFNVEKIELEYRPTPLTPEDAEGKGGLKGWIKLMGANFLEAVSDQEKALKLVEELLHDSVTKPDGTQWLGYVRLRGIAKKS